MTSLALILVLSSAFTHALWNFIAKRAIGGISFIWIFAVMEVIIYMPIYLVLQAQGALVLGTLEWVMIFGSALFHLCYFVSLMYGYQAADLSVVYPFSRGIGPVLSTIGAILIMKENPSTLALLGTFFISVGIIGLTGDPRKFRSRKLLKGLFFATITGLTIAGYTLWDSYAMSTVGLMPFIYQWGVTTIRMIVLTPIALRQRDKVKVAWQRDKWKAFGVAVLSSLSYILMLSALSFSMISYVAPLRSISILMGVVMGGYFLKEAQLRRRFGAASFMVIGAIALGLG